jgi:hypothetical protein
MAAERSAARLAHQSGGLGVPGSNPGAPTKKCKYFKYFMGLRAFADQGENGTERHESAHSVDVDVFRAIRSVSHGNAGFLGLGRRLTVSSMTSGPWPSVARTATCAYNG